MASIIVEIQNLLAAQISSHTIEKTCDFLQSSLEKKNFDSIVFGLSGGIDSAVVGVLCKKALKKHQKILAVCMPAIHSNPIHLQDAKTLCTQFDIPYTIHSITPYEKIFREENPTRLRLGNFLARIRMNILYDYSAKNNALVIGTSNKSELMLGYGTLHGDLACAINPIATFYKTQIFQIAKILNLPQNIIQKSPSADLYPNQSDSDELGYSYEILDPLLFYISQNFPVYKTIDSQFLISQGFDTKMVQTIVKRIQSNLFKHEHPLIQNF